MGIQTFFNSDGTALTAVITIIGSDGNHVDPDSWPITNDPAIVLSSHPAATKTVTQVDTGVYKAVWSSLSPALTHGEIVFIAVDGDISGTAWSTWQIPVQVVHLPAKPADITTVTNLLTSTGSNDPLERSPEDTNDIAFQWPVSGATITAEVSIDNAAYAATTGTVSYLRAEGSKYYYVLAYNAADRPATEGTARYKLDDGTYTRYITLRVEGSSVDAAGIRSAIGMDAANLDDQLADIPTVAEFEARTLPSGDYFNSSEDEVTVGSVTESGVSSIFSTYSLSESYAASGVEGTPAQILYFIQQTFSEFAISGVYITVSKLDGTTTAAQFILDDEDTPLSRSRIS